jgi:LPS-assembly lipoprotein
MLWPEQNPSFRGINRRAAAVDETGIQSHLHGRALYPDSRARGLSPPPGMTRKIIRLMAVLAIAGLTAGCFQPLYGDVTPALGGGNVTEKLAGVEIAPINTPNGTRLSRVGVVVREALIYDMTGGGAVGMPTHKLVVRLTSRQLQAIVDITTARPDIQNYGIDATYQLIDLRTGKPVISGQTFSRVSYNIPGQEQRFAGQRGLLLFRGGDVKPRAPDAVLRRSGAVPNAGAVTVTGLQRVTSCCAAPGTRKYP